MFENLLWYFKYKKGLQDENEELKKENKTWAALATAKPVIYNGFKFLVTETQDDYNNYRYKLDARMLFLRSLDILEFVHHLCFKDRIVISPYEFKRYKKSIRIHK